MWVIPKLVAVRWVPHTWIEAELESQTKNERLVAQGLRRAGHGQLSRPGSARAKKDRRASYVLRSQLAPRGVCRIGTLGTRGVEMEARPC